MANRSDKNSVLPRRFKRLLALTSDLVLGQGWDPKTSKLTLNQHVEHTRSAMKRGFITAHAHAKKVDRAIIGVSVNLSTSELAS